MFSEKLLSERNYFCTDFIVLWSDFVHEKTLTVHKFGTSI